MVTFLEGKVDQKYCKPETVDIVRKIGESLIFMSPDCFDAHPTRLDHVVRRPLSMCLKFKLKLVIFGNPACEL